MVDAATMIRAGSAGLFVLLGLVVAILGRRRAGPAALGLYLGMLGVYLVVQNLYRTPGVERTWIMASILLCVGASALATSVLMPTRVARGGRRAVVAGWLTGTLATAALFGSGWEALDPILFIDGVPASAAIVMRATASLFCMASIGLVATVSWRVALHPPASVAESRRFAALAAGTGLWWAFQMATLHLDPTSPWSFLATSIVVVGLCVPWLIAGARAHQRLPTLIALVWPALAMLAYLYQLRPANADNPFLDPWGLYGILRVLGWTALLAGIVRADLLGVPLPHIVVRRGAVAGSALATLFIVAQVAQNFLSAEYGLYTGGVVAGAFLFLASPAQRAFERLGERRTPEDTTILANTSRREESYRKALRIALRDKRLTAVEEGHLFELAEDLGIPAGRAFHLKSEILAELGAHRKSR